MATTIRNRFAHPHDDPRGPYALVDLTAPVPHRTRHFDWRGHVPPTGRTWKFTAKHLEELYRKGMLFFPDKGPPRLKRYLSQIGASVRDDQSVKSRIEVIVRESMRSLAVEVARNPSTLPQIEWRDLERILREVFDGLGFHTELTRPGKDGGFDLKLTCYENGLLLTYLVEVKHWIAGSKRASLPLVTALFDIVVSLAGQATGVLLSTSGFTGEVFRGRTEIEQQRVRIGGKEKIVSLCQNYLAVSNGLWKPATDLPELLLQGTV